MKLDYPFLMRILILLYLSVLYMSQLQAGLFREILNIDQYNDNATFYYTELASEFGLNIQADVLEKNIIDDDALVMKGNISCDHSAKLHYRSYNYYSRDLYFEIHKKSNGLLLTLPKETECTLKITSNLKYTRNFIKCR